MPEYLTFRRSGRGGGETQSQLQANGGNLVAEFRGEWGGALKFVPAKPEKKTIVVKEGPARFVFRFARRIFLLEGLAHLSFNEGELFEVDTTTSAFACRKLFPLGAAPEAFTVHGNQLFIATCGGFCLVSQDMKPTIVFKDAFWAGLYPTSIVVLDDHNVFMGMRGGIAKLDVVAKTIEFYTED